MGNRSTDISLSLSLGLLDQMDSVAYEVPEWLPPDDKVEDEDPPAASDWRMVLYHDRNEPRTIRMQSGGAVK